MNLREVIKYLGLKTTDYVRWVVTIALLYGAYTETGIWTLILLVLLSIYIELEGLLSRTQNKLFKTITENL